MIPDRARVLLSVQRALLGETAPGVRAIAVDWNENRIRIQVLHDGPWDAAVEEDFDAGAVTQVVADFPWPERGDPQVDFEFARFDGSGPLPALPGGAAYVYARNDAAWRDPRHSP